MDKAVANYAGRLINETDVLDKFLAENKRNKTLLQKMVDGIRKLIRKVTGAEKRQLQTVEGKLLAAMNAATEKADKVNINQSVNGNAQFSLKTFPNGMLYVQATRQVIFGNDPDAWSDQLENYINKEIRQGNDVQLVGADGEVLLLTATSAGKLSSYYTSDGRTMSQDAYERKVNAAAHIDELVQASRKNGQHKDDTGGRHGEMASKGWTYRSAYFMDFDGQYYRATISVAHGPENSVVYNIGAIKKEALPKIVGSDVVSGNGPRGNASTSSISTSPGNVKTKFSLKESVEETKDLIAVHNVSEQGLLGALELDVSTIAYEAGNSEDWLAKLNSAENSKFSIKGSDTEKGRRSNYREPVAGSRQKCYISLYKQYIQRWRKCQDKIPHKGEPGAHGLRAVPGHGGEKSRPVMQNRSGTEGQSPGTGNQDTVFADDGTNYSTKTAIEQEATGQFRLYCLNKGKATALLQGARVLMPKMPASSNGFIHTLSDSRSPVNQCDCLG